MNKYNISWWRTEFQKGEIEAVAEAITGEHISQGPVVAEFERRLAAYLGVPYVVTTTSGSMALLMSLWAAGIGPGDEIIVPNRTWIATAHAGLLLGAKIKLVDVEPLRPIIAIDQIERALTDRTRAIIPVHMCGRSADMLAINSLAAQKGIVVIEDAAQALGSRNPSGYLGTQSDLGCFSLSVAKVISTGQGGFIATQDKGTYDRLIAMRTQGVGDIVNAQWTQPGFNFRFTDVLAAIGIVQLRKLPDRIETLKQIYNVYAKGLAGLSSIKLIPVNIEAGEVPVYIEAMCSAREDLVNHLAHLGIQCRPFYPDLNTAAYFQCPGSYPNAAEYGRQGVYLPTGPEQPLENIETVIEEIRKFD